jgi:hypothetical protein
MADIRNQGYDYPDVAVHGAENTAPAAATVLADSLVVPVAGHWRFRVVCVSDDTIINRFQIAHRNAANTADIELAETQVSGSATPPIDALFNMAAGERVVVRNAIVGTAAKVYKVDLYGWALP